MSIIFFGRISLNTNIMEEMYNMVKGIAVPDEKCQILSVSKFIGLGATGIDGNGHKALANRGNIIALVDGEIYNTSDLCNELGRRKDPTDGNLADILISAYEKWGTECFSKLNGIYAIALWDGKNTKFYLNRDPHGVKSLYYHFDEKMGLTFASRLRDIFRRKNVSPEIKLTAVQEYLRFLDISTPNTIYKNVYSLEPGCILECDGENCSIRQLVFQSDELPPVTFDDTLDRFEFLLTKSLEQRFNRKSTGFFLSGGVDSTLLCALGSKIAHSSISAFTVGFEGKKLNEIPIAKQIARFLGINHHELYFNIEQYLYAFDKITSSIDSPFADPATIPTLLSFNYCREYVNVVIDGTGSDGLFGALPPRYIRFVLSYSSKLHKKIRRKIVSFLKIHSKLNEYTPMFDFEDPQEFFIRWKGWKRNEIERLCGLPCTFSNTSFYKAFNKNNKLNPVELYSILMSNMPDDRLHEMAFLSGLNIRFPYWDKNFVSFVKKLDVNYKYRDGISKFLLKKLLARYVPEKLWNFPKHGFDFPFETLIKWNDYEFIKRYLSKETLRIHNFFNEQIVKNYVDRYINGDSSLRFKIWALIVFHAWYLSHH